MWDIVWVLPQGHRSVSVSRHFLLLAPHVPVPCENGSAGTTVAEGGRNPIARLTTNNRHTTTVTYLWNKSSQNGKSVFLYSFRLCRLWKQEIQVKNFVHQWDVTVILLQLILHYTFQHVKFSAPTQISLTLILILTISLSWCELFSYMHCSKTELVKVGRRSITLKLLT